VAEIPRIAIDTTGASASSRSRRTPHPAAMTAIPGTVSPRTETIRGITITDQESLMHSHFSLDDSQSC